MAHIQSEFDEFEALLSTVLAAVAAQGLDRIEYRAPVRTKECSGVNLP
jgi:hypothetical protein